MKSNYATAQFPSENKTGTRDLNTHRGWFTQWISEWVKEQAVAWVRQPIINRIIGINPDMIGTQALLHYQRTLPPPTAGSGDKVLLAQKVIPVTSGTRILESWRLLQIKFWQNNTKLSITYSITSHNNQTLDWKYGYPKHQQVLAPLF